MNAQTVQKITTINEFIHSAGMEPLQGARNEDSSLMAQNVHARHCIGLHSKTISKKIRASHRLPDSKTLLKPKRFAIQKSCALQLQRSKKFTPTRKS